MRPTSALLATILAVTGCGAAPDAFPFPALENHIDSLIGQVRDRHGFTVDPRDGHTPITGYAVNTGTGAMVVPADDFFGEAGHGALRGYVLSHASTLLSDKALDLGAWYNEQAREVVLSTVSVLADRQDAIRLGVEHHQREIFDLAINRTVPTGGEPQAAG